MSQFVDLSDNIQLAEEKFNTCINRTKNKVKGRVGTCCGRTKEVEDFACELKKIFPLSAVKDCQKCQEWKKND